MCISGGSTDQYIQIGVSGNNNTPTIYTKHGNRGSLGTRDKTWGEAHIETLYVDKYQRLLPTYIVDLISGENSDRVGYGCIRLIRIIVNNKDSDITIFSAGSNVSGYLIYPGSLANGSCNYQTSTLAGTWKLLSALMTPSGIGGDQYSGSLYAIAMRVA